MPTFALRGNLVHFAAYKNHIGFYPTSSGIAAFKDELSQYKGAKVHSAISDRKAASLYINKRDCQI